MDDFVPLDRRTTRLFVDVTEIVANNLAAMARKVSVSRNLYVKQLFEAAYAARCAPTGDRELDAAMRSPAIGAGAPPNPPNQGSGGKRGADAVAALRGELAQERARSKKLADDLRVAEDERNDLSHRLSMALTAQKLRASIETIAKPAPEPEPQKPQAADPAPDNAPDSAPLTRGEIKIIRGLASVGNSAAKIAKETGFPVRAVNAALKSGAAAR